MELHPLHQSCLRLAERSPDLKLKYGALVEVNGVILGKGYNHPPEGYSCEFCPRVVDRSIKSGTQLEKCFAIHAEQAAILDTAHNGYGTFLPQATLWFMGIHPETGPMLYQEPLFTCSFCARIMAGAGIQKVMCPTVKGPRGMTQAEYLKDSFRVALG